jgi:hypothetical protein
VDDGVEVGDLAEAVAPELEGGRHEAEAPLADVERRAPLVLARRVAVRDDHLGERQPVGDRPDPAVVVVADGVEHHALARVEADPHRPPLPCEPVAVERERDALGLGDRDRLEVVA